MALVILGVGLSFALFFASLLECVGCLTPFFEGARQKEKTDVLHSECKDG